MNLKLKLPFSTLALTAPWSAFAQGVVEAASAPASGVHTQGGRPIIEWAVVVGVSAIVSAVVATAVAKKVVADSQNK